MGILAGASSKSYGSFITLTPAQQLYNGPSNPTWFGSINNNFAFRNFSLGVNISFKGGYYFRRSSINYNSLFSNWQGNQDFVSRWQVPGDEIRTNVPSMVYPANSSRDAFYTQSSILVERGDHIRLQDISLSYDFPKNLLKPISLNSLELFCYANNLGILWRKNKQELDPDYLAGFPMPRTVSFGVKFGL
jgi:hypothetical protein